MSLHYLGEVIDIHTGGIDLRFPHHEDERAQSDAVDRARGGPALGARRAPLFEGRDGQVHRERGAPRRPGRPGPGPAGAAAGVPRAPLPAADEPDLGRRWPPQTARCAGGGSGWPSGPSSPSRPMCAQYVAQFTGGVRRRPGHPGRAAACCARWRRTARSRRARSSRRSRTPTSCSAWIWPATSAAPAAAAAASRRGGSAQRAGGGPEAADWPAADRLRAELAPTGRHGHRHPAGPDLDRRRTPDHATIRRLQPDSQRIDGCDAACAHLIRSDPALSAG